jgi:hypothetical protein
MLGDGDGVRQGLAEVRLEVPDARGVRTSAGHERGTRRAADGLLAVGPVEGGALGGDAVEVRGLDQRAAGGVDLRTQVIDGDEQHVEFLGVGRMEHDGEEEPKGQETGHFHRNLPK